MELDKVNLWYGDTHALRDVSFDIYPSEILAFIGPSGCGKSTALKCLNRMHDDTRDVIIKGRIVMDGRDIHDPDIDPPMHRRRFGWVAQKPNPFPMSIWKNVAYGAQIHGLMTDRTELEAHVEDFRRCPLADRLVQGVENKASGHRSRNAPSDNLAGKDVDHESNIDHAGAPGHNYCALHYFSASMAKLTRFKVRREPEAAVAL